MPTLTADKTKITIGETVTFGYTFTGRAPFEFIGYINNQEVEMDLIDPQPQIAYFTYTFEDIGEYEVYITSTKGDSNTVTITVSEPVSTVSWTINNKTVQSLTIGNKEIQTITRVSDGAILYQKSTSPTPIPSTISITATKDVLSKHHSDTSTLTATVLDEDNNACVGETVTFKNGSTVLGADTTDANG